jgi:hypothetical protein
LTGPAALFSPLASPPPIPALKAQRGQQVPQLPPVREPGRKRLAAPCRGCISSSSSSSSRWRRRVTRRRRAGHAHLRRREVGKEGDQVEIALEVVQAKAPGGRRGRRRPGPACLSRVRVGGIASIVRFGVRGRRGGARGRLAPPDICSQVADSGGGRLRRRVDGGLGDAAPGQNPAQVHEGPVVGQR